MATSEVYIFNLAHSHLGDGGRVASRTENTKAAYYCNLHYEQARDNVLAAHRWDFARKYVVLADLGDPPSPWDYRYAYPTDCITARQVVSANWPPSANPEPFALGVSDALDMRCLFTDVEEAILCYTARVTDPLLFPAPFTLALSWHLAELVCTPLTGDLKLKTTLLAGYRAALSAAATFDANEGVEILERVPDGIAARA